MQLPTTYYLPAPATNDEDLLPQEDICPAQCPCSKPRGDSCIATHLFLPAATVKQNTHHPCSSAGQLVSTHPGNRGQDGNMVQGPSHFHLSSSESTTLVQAPERQQHRNQMSVWPQTIWISSEASSSRLSPVDVSMETRRTQYSTCTR
ncbi:hypothetical protein CDEST_12138 [Colletotrichum destructivum]|uniref:Uncharacterized protein n=1 Tax=Colletotrichum destructivum TaxID=34406 RepID=A0AAX4IV92_9PEZI|nr:hypothetical protein CDEST_12138 [Colletotrichum destructivum]